MWRDGSRSGVFRNAASRARVSMISFSGFGSSVTVIKIKMFKIARRYVKAERSKK